MRNTYYADFLPLIIGNAIESGTIYYSVGSAKVNFAARMDMAEANAVVLADPDNHKNKTYEITSGAAYSFSDIADMLTELTGKSINYVDIPLDTLKQNLTKGGLPGEVAELMASIAASMGAGEFDYVDNSLKELIGREPTDLRNFLATVYRQ